MNFTALFLILSLQFAPRPIGFFAGIFGILFFTVGIIVMMFLIGGLAYLVMSHFREERIKALHLFASQNGWTFAPNATPDIFQNPTAYSIFNQRTPDIIALLQRPHDGGTASVFDYAYTVESGKNHTTFTQTVVAFHTPRLQLPFFALCPESFFSFIGEMFGYTDIDFATHPRFSDSFKLTGQNEIAIRQIFHPQALSFFEAIPKVRVDGGGNYLFIYVHDQTYQPENLNAFLNMALSIYNLFRLRR